MIGGLYIYIYRLVGVHLFYWPILNHSMKQNYALSRCVSRDETLGLTDECVFCRSLFQIRMFGTQVYQFTTLHSIDRWFKKRTVAESDNPLRISNRPFMSTSWFWTVPMFGFWSHTFYILVIDMSPSLFGMFTSTWSIGLVQSQEYKLLPSQNIYIYMYCIHKFDYTICFYHLYIHNCVIPLVLHILHILYIIMI